MSRLLNFNELITFLPDFMKQFVEMQEIMKVGDIELERLDTNTQVLLSDAYIEDCDEYGIQKYEKMLGITPNEEESLESRKTAVLLYWNDSVPPTWRILIEKLNNYLDVNNYDLDYDLERYHIDFTIYDKSDEIKSFLERTIPQNMTYNIYSAARNGGIGRIGMIWQDDEIFNLRQVV